MARLEGRPGEAVEHYKRAVTLDPVLLEAHVGLGLALAASGDPEGAVVHYREAMRLDPGSFEVHNNLGSAMQNLGRLD